MASLVGIRWSATYADQADYILSASCSPIPLILIELNSCLTAMADDSPLSIAANIIGIITFAFAVAAAIYARWLWLKSRILLSQAFERSYDRLELVMWGVGMLHDPIDFEPSEALMHMFERIYTDCFSMYHRLAKMARKTALKTRITKSDAEEYLKLLASLETRYPIARKWYMHEQTLAAITCVAFSTLAYARY